MKWKWLILAGGLMLTVMLGSVPVRAADLPAELTAALTLKVLTFDRNLADRAGAEIVVGVAYLEADQAWAEGLRKGFDAYLDKKVSGLSIKVVLHPFTDTADLGAWIDADKVSVLFLSPGLLDQAKTVHGLATAKKCLTAGTSASFPETGTALGFETADGKPRIVINIGRSKEEGVDFSSDLLSIARVI